MFRLNLIQFLFYLFSLKKGKKSLKHFWMFILHFVIEFIAFLEASYEKTKPFKHSFFNDPQF